MFIAEREGFEPPVPLSTSVFKTGAIDHSATSPKIFIVKKCGPFFFDDAKVYQSCEPCKYFSRKIQYTEKNLNKRLLTAIIDKDYPVAI